MFLQSFGVYVRKYVIRVACVCVCSVCYNWFISEFFVERLGSDSESCVFVCAARLLSSYICLDGFVCSL